MSRDVVVYAKRGEVVPLEDILARLRRLGTPASWQSMFGGSETEGWSMGDLEPEPGPGGAITISTEPVDDPRRQSALKAYAATLSESLRQHLSEARVVYQLSVPFTREPRRDRLLANLVETLAELGDGVIVDTATNRVEDLDTFRSRSGRDGGA
jgi:hypothetical protein